MYNTKNPNIAIGTQDEIPQMFVFQGTIILRNPLKTSVRYIRVGFTHLRNITASIVPNLPLGKETKIRVATSNFLIQQMLHNRDGFKWSKKVQAFGANCSRCIKCHYNLIDNK